MSKFSIGELVKIKNGPIANTPCVVTGYAGIGEFSREQLYHLCYYGGGVILDSFSESNLERNA